MSGKPFVKTPSTTSQEYLLASMIEELNNLYNTAVEINANELALMIGAAAMAASDQLQEGGANLHTIEGSHRPHYHH